MVFQLNPLNSPNKLWILLIITTLLRLIIASNTTLGNDEVYYWTYAQDLQWNYFDHPPFVAFLIRATTLDLLVNHEITVRTGAILSAGLGTWLVCQIGTYIHNEKAGWYAALLYSASFYSSIIAGTFILPDSPQLVFWLTGILLLLKINRAADQNLPTLQLWLLFGLAAGLCILCKAHGVFLWVAAAINSVMINKKLLNQRGLYIASAISILILLPVILWNIRHDFITYTYHSGRVTPLHNNIKLLSFSREIAGEICYNNPVIFLFSWAAVFSCIRGRQQTDRQTTSVLLACSLPLLFSPILLSLFRETLPHWSGPAYTCLIILSAVELATDRSPKIPGILISALFFFVFVVVAGLLFINLCPGTFGSQENPEECGKGDPTLDLYGWKETGRLIDSVYRQDQATLKMTQNAPIIVTKWYPAAHLDFYAARLTGQQTYGIGEVFDLHQYYWSNANKSALRKGQDAYYIVPSNLWNKQDTEKISSHFTFSAPPLTLPVYRNGKICKNILIFRLRGYSNP